MVKTGNDEECLHMCVCVCVGGAVEEREREVMHIVGSSIV